MALFVVLLLGSLLIIVNLVPSLVISNTAPSGISAADRLKATDNLRTALMSILGGVVVIMAVLAGVSGVVESRRQVRAVQERLIAELTARRVAKQMGTEETASLFVGDIDHDPVREKPWQGRAVDEEVARRVQLVEDRMRAVEDKFPDASDFQKYAQANELFFAFQIGEVLKRLDRLEERQLSRSQIVGIFLATLITMIGAGGAILGILKALSVIH